MQSVIERNKWLEERPLSSLCIQWEVYVIGYDTSHNGDVYRHGVLTVHVYGIERIQEIHVCFIATTVLSTI
jgi:hypothetical protein